MDYLEFERTFNDILEKYDIVRISGYEGSVSFRADSYSIVDNTIILYNEKHHIGNIKLSAIEGLW